ncbi:hypothetical protein [Fulvivirga sediminis]|uniref:Uncharacterized protein n=1 Tax=Fulvivirga sediminis TaxID=2803949 RepID=A0A937K0V3_9BACT|nr:hypothetical protein [Fulvivirga sediminis]MBL3656680.1 hypothetical protein [Fulvivirga sediminis]
MLSLFAGFTAEVDVAPEPGEAGASVCVEELSSASGADSFSSASLSSLFFLDHFQKQD